MANVSFSASTRKYEVLKMVRKKTERPRKSENENQSEGEVKTSHRKKDLERLAQLRLFDDAFMTAVFQDNEPAAEVLLNAILGKKVHVVHIETQRIVYDEGYHKIRMDIHIVDDQGNQANVEIQRARDGAHPRRARFNSAKLDSRMLDPGQNYKELQNSYIIFITEMDYFGDGEPFHSYSRRCDQNPAEVLGDGSIIIYVNGAFVDDNHPVGRVMHDFRCLNAKDMFHPEFADRVRRLKETEGGQAEMYGIMEEIRNEGIIEGEIKGRQEGKAEMAYEMAKQGMSVKTIAKIANVDLATVNEWLAKMASTLQ